jgi:aspartate-semialdehyde dehydrogenase
LTFKLKKDVPLADIEAMIATDNSAVKFAYTRSQYRDPTVAVTGTMQIPADEFATRDWDQNMALSRSASSLCQGAAEPLRRMLRILLAS